MRFVSLEFIRHRSTRLFRSHVAIVKYGFTWARLRNPHGLTNMHKRCILMHMRTTLNIDDETLNRAAELTGIKEKTSLVRLGLEALIARESSKRLAELGATEKDLRPVPRRRMADS